MGLKSKIKKIIPARLISFYHLFLAFLAGVFYRWPTKKMITVGITGTKGKTSAANFIWSVLNSNGIKAGIIGTAQIRIGDVEIPNKYHMTMPGRFVLQKYLKKMADAGCEYCVIETTSQGLAQWRHFGIFYDIAIFTNLTPEHLESHGGFENYKKSKGKLFSSLARGGQKTIGGKKIEKTIIANFDSPHKNYFLDFPADKKITYGLIGGDFAARDVKNTAGDLEFFIGPEKYDLNVLGRFNVYNALPAIIVGSLAGLPYDKIKSGLEKLKTIPGRMEKIDAGQNFYVFVDYAHERASMSAALDAAREIAETGARVIAVIGSEGGGRDKIKRSDLGEIAAKKADIVVITATDPYEEDPKKICEEIAAAAERFGKVRGENLYIIEDRRKAIAEAISFAGRNDIILVTGMGAQQSMIVGEKHIRWDDRIVVREELEKLKN